MKINTFETHDRLLNYQNKQMDMSDAIMECIRNVPDDIKSSFYVFGHSRTIQFDEKVGMMKLGHHSAEKRLIWTPRITKPKAEPNSYLFLCRKNSDIIEIIWMLPQLEMWSEYAPGKMMHNENIWISINSYIDNLDLLNAADKEGPKEKDELEWRKIYGMEAHRKKNMAKLEI